MSHPSVTQIINETRTQIVIDEIVKTRDYNALWGLNKHYTGFCGKKLFSPTLCNNGLLDIVNCPAIVTYRNNKLSQYISRLLARRYGWSIHEYGSQKVHVQIEDAVRFIKSTIEVEETIRKRIKNCLWVEYGEITSGECFTKMQEFLGVKPIKLTSHLNKQSKGPLIDYVANVDELLDSELAGWI